jgi:hypothetical protein
MALFGNPSNKSTNFTLVDATKIFKDEGVDCFLLDFPGKMGNVQTVVVPLQALPFEEAAMTLVMIPGMEEFTDGLSMLQFNLLYPLKDIPSPDALAHLQRLMCKANFGLSVGAFLYDDDMNHIVLRYNLAFNKVKDQHMDMKLTRIKYLFFSNFQTHLGPMEKLAMGEITYDEVFEKELVPYPAHSKYSEVFSNERLDDCRK